MSAKSFVRAMRDKGFIQQMARSNRYNWLGIGIALSDTIKEVFTEAFWQR
jgi:hypothetical protein